jgi:phosphopantothenoylcysteine decarboxylase/phosphopantothenate--cysteine ligase
MLGKNIVLGVSGGIAAYKACELASRLTQQGARVDVVLTANAQQFVTPLTFQALTHRSVHTSLWPDSTQSEAGVFAAMAHIALADEADAILIAPASADLIARLAHGLADDLLSTLVLATRAPVLIAPAMNPKMLSHPATQRNLLALQKFGYHIIEPEVGRMACEHVGSGRLPTTEVLITELERVLTPPVRDLAGLKVLVTAGPTREPLDPVRYLSNRSSGRMGFEIAANAAMRGAKVLLVSGPTSLCTPDNVQRFDVQTTQELHETVQQHWPACDVLIAAAAPADYRAEEVAPQKIKKLVDAGLQLHLVPNPDVVATAGKAKSPGQIVVAFAAETQNLHNEARRKLTAKNADAIVANDVSQSDAGFDVETNRVSWITSGNTEAWPLLSKTEVAARIWDKVLGLRSVNHRNTL